MTIKKLLLWTTFAPLAVWLVLKTVLPAVLAVAAYLVGLAALALTMALAVVWLIKGRASVLAVGERMLHCGLANLRLLAGAASQGLASFADGERRERDDQPQAQDEPQPEPQVAA